MPFRVSTAHFQHLFLDSRPWAQNPFAQKPAVLPVRRNIEWLQETSPLTLRPSHLTKERWNDRHKWEFKVFTDLKKKEKNPTIYLGLPKRKKIKGKKKTKKKSPPTLLSFVSRNGWIIFISNFSKGLAWGREQRLNAAAPWESSKYLLPV